MPSPARLLPTGLALALVLGARLASALQALPTPEQAAVPAPVPDEAWRGTPVGRIVAVGNHRTRSEIVIQEVLLRSGDLYDPELARESERNLRALPFLGSARLRARPDATGESVDIVVAVTERFPWVGGVLPSFGGGEIEVDVAAGTGNFLGRGQLAGFRANVSSRVADSYSIVFSEPRIGGSRWGVTANLGVQGDVGPRNRLQLQRRLYSLSTEWAFEAQVFDEAEQRLLYSGGETVADYRRRRTGASLALLRAFRRDDRRLELRLGVTHADDEHERSPDAGGVLPRDKRRTSAIAELRAERFRFVEERDFQRMGPVEDVRLGLWAGVRAGAALEVLGSDRSYPILGLDVGWYAGGPERGYFRFDAAADGRLEGGAATNLIARSSVRTYLRTPGQGLFAAWAQLAFLDRLEDPAQLLLDAQNGARGYRAHAEDGSRRVVASVEWRRRLGRVGPVATGAVIFVDGGAIWSEQRRLSESRFLLGLGAGLRLGLATVIGAPVLRLDVGYGVRDGTWEVSGGLGQRF
jgi:hypothetical protein